MSDDLKQPTITWVPQLWQRNPDYRCVPSERPSLTDEERTKILHILRQRATLRTQSVY